ncbi:hypothetical protein A5893_11125 [Pedobacter psychrophilus]|uniref:Lipoprotein n=1 Tax=Pedobacter psychrophilus TaxID=1826909 RepID=A0A179DDV7_9SPHI|nr:hypothetical protein [Pedobacter psychrophilus]OAQ39211.1 hypothetical protein A5893_11125 [Pedobacter psychrophilus]
MAHNSIRKYINTILVSLSIFYSCSNTRDNNAKAIEFINSLKNKIELDKITSPTCIEENKNSIILSTKTNGPEKCITELLDKNIEIIILKSYLDNYLENMDNLSRNFRYKDVQINLIIKQNSKVILDTTFRREQFVKQILKQRDGNFISKSFLQVYRFSEYHNDSNTIIFYGDIGYDEYMYSESSFQFKHFFDLKNRKLSFSLYQSEED